MTVLVVLGGLPGSGKTTIARRLARATGATLLRIDVIEQALRDHAGLGEDVGPAGYWVAFGLAESNLALGRCVIADSVNPIEATRQGWRDVAARTGASVLEVEIVCADRDEHRRRVEGRRSDVPGLRLPNWQEVCRRKYDPWPEARAVDTSRLGPDEACALIAADIAKLAET